MGRRIAIIEILKDGRGVVGIDIEHRVDLI
jgi:hypothetical protein